MYGYKLPPFNLGMNIKLFLKSVWSFKQLLEDNLEIALYNIRLKWITCCYDFFKLIKDAVEETFSR